MREDDRPRFVLRRSRLLRGLTAAEEKEKAN